MPLQTASSSLLYSETTALQAFPRSSRKPAKPQSMGHRLTGEEFIFYDVRLSLSCTSLPAFYALPEELVGADIPLYDILDEYYQHHAAIGLPRSNDPPTENIPRRRLKAHLRVE